MMRFIPTLLLYPAVCRIIIRSLFFISVPLVPARCNVVSSNSDNLLIRKVLVLKYKEHYQEAISLLNNILISNTDPALKLQIINEQADLLGMTGRLRDAWKAFQKFEILSKESGNIDPELVSCHHFYLGRYYKKRYQQENADSDRDSSIYYFTKCNQEIINSHLDGSILQGMVFYEMGFMAARFLDDYEKARRYFSESGSIFQRLMDPKDPRLGTLFHDFSVVSRQLGDYERAVNYVRLAYLIRSDPANDMLERALQSQIVMANILYNRFEYESAVTQYKEVISKAEKIYGPKDQRLFIAVQNCGEALIYTGNLEEARNFLEKAVRINTVSNFTDSLNLSYTYLSLAELHETLADVKTAEKYLQGAFVIRKKLLGEKGRELYRAARILGGFYERRDQIGNALDHYQLAFMYLYPDFYNSDIYTLPEEDEQVSSEDLYYILFDKARAFYKLYKSRGERKDLQYSFQLYDRVYTLFNKSGDSDFFEESILDIPDAFQEELNLGITIALELFDLTGEEFYFEAAFRFIEQNKYIILEKEMAGSSGRSFLGIPDSVLQIERLLDEEINGIKHKISQLGAKEGALEYEYRIELLRKGSELNALRNGVNESIKRDYNPSDRVDLDDLLRIIDDGTAIMEFHSTKDMIYNVVLTKSSKDVVRIDNPHELQLNIDAYLDHLSGRALQDDPMDAYLRFTSTAHYLYRHLLLPALNKIADHKLELQRIIIISDGELAFMPFECMISEEAATSGIDYFGLRYIGGDYTFSYAYSLNILYKNQHAPPKYRKPEILAFSYSSTSTDSEVAQRSDELTELSYSAGELQSIKKWFPKGRFFGGSEATESRFKQLAPDFPVLHLAIHGTGDRDDHFNSRLEFKASMSDSLNDGKLYAYELYGMDLSRTRLAVLSACESGIGMQSKGEGIYSMARGFAYAGCPSVIISLWKVGDKATAALMDNYYRFLSEGMPLDECLRMAKVEYIQNSDEYLANPANWAAFISMGNYDAVVIKKQRELPYIVTVLIILFLSLVYYFRTRYNKHRRKNSTYGC